MIGWLRRLQPEPDREERRQVSDALVDYPPYSPPPWNADEPRAYQYFFRDQRSTRLEAFGIFLARFGLALNLADDGAQAVSDWYPVYADLLVDGIGSDPLRAAYHEFAVPWTGTLAGLNPIFDLGVYLGECMLARNPRLRWQALRVADGATHMIFGLRDGRPFDPISWTYTECRNICVTKRLVNGFFRPPHVDDVFIRGTRLLNVMVALSK